MSLNHPRPSDPPGVEFSPIRIEVRLGKDGRLTVCDVSGRPLPGQRAVTIQQRLKDVTTVTIEFVVDRDRVRLVPE